MMNEVFQQSSKSTFKARGYMLFRKGCKDLFQSNVCNYEFICPTIKFFVYLTEVMLELY